MPAVALQLPPPPPSTAVATGAGVATSPTMAGNRGASAPPAPAGRTVPPIPPVVPANRPAPPHPVVAGRTAPAAPPKPIPAPVPTYSRTAPAPPTTVALAQPTAPVSQKRRLQIAGIAAAGVLLLVVGMAGLSGIGSKRVPEPIVPASSIPQPVVNNVDTSTKVSPSPEPTTPSKQRPPVSDVAKVDQQARPLAVLQLLSLSALTERMEWLNKVIGDKDQLTSFIGNCRAIAASGMIVADKPCGAYFHVKDRDAAGGVVIAVPVKSDETIRQGLAENGFTEVNRTGKITLLNVPIASASSGVSIPTHCYLRFANGYACFAVGDPAVLEDGQIPAWENVFDSSETKMLAVTVRTDELPNQLRDEWIRQRGGLTSQIAAFDPATRKYGEQYLQILIDFVDAVLNGKHRLRFAFDMGQTKRGPSNIEVDLEVIAEPGSPLASNLGSLVRVPSRFGELDLTDSTLGARVNLRLPQSLRDSLPFVVKSVTEQVLGQIRDNPAEKAAHERLFNVLGPTIAAGELDVAFSLLSDGGTQPPGVVAGLKVVNGQELDKYFQEVMKDPEQRALGSFFQLNADAIGDIQTHRFVTQQLPPEFEQIFGELPVNLVFGPDMIGYSAGTKSKERLGQLLQAQPQHSAIAQLVMKIKPLTELFPLPGREEAAKAFSLSDPGRVGISLEAREGLLHLSFSVSGSVLKAAISHIPVSFQVERQSVH